MRNRIWGNMIGGTQRSGFKELAKPMKGPQLVEWYAQSDLKYIFPFIRDWDASNKSKTAYEERKLRIFMRGIKIGNRKEGKMKGMDIFTQAKQKDDEAAVKAGVDAQPKA